MLIDPVLPRPLDPANNQNETLTVLNAVISQVHLNRPLARRLGWRGVLPSSTHWPSWTVRIASSPFIYGITYTEEALSGEQLVGHFMLFAFPESVQAAQDAGYSLWAQQLIGEQSEEYGKAIRHLSGNVQNLMPFYLGDLELSLSPDGEGAALIASAVSRQTVESRLAEGGLVSDMRPLRLLMPLVSTLANSMREALGTTGEVVVNATETPALVLTEEGIVENTERAERLVSVSLAMGKFMRRIPGHRLSYLPLAHVPQEHELSNQPIIHIVSGFLGAGKTTFLKEWLEYLHGRERFTGVVQNEFGEVDLDSLVLKGETQVETLEDGCVCCSLADSLRPGLMRLIANTPAEQFILETTGVASPSNVAASIRALNDIVQPGLLITLVDAYDLTQHPEKLTEAGCRLDQIEAADVLVCSKADLINEDELKALMDRLHDKNEQALILPAAHGRIPFGVLDSFFVRWLDERDKPLPSRQVKREAFGWSGMRRSWAPVAVEAATPYESFTVRFDAPITTETLEAIIRDAGPGVVRAKGVVDVLDQGCRLIQYAADRLECDPADELESRVSDRYLVVIGENLIKPEAA